MSYLKFLNVILDIVFYLLIVSVFAVMSMPFISSFYPTSAVKVGMQIPVQLKGNGSFSENGLTGTISSSDYANLGIELAGFGVMSENALLYGVMLLNLTMLAGGLVFLVYQLKQIVRTVGTPTVFSQANVVRIRTIGGLLIASELVKPIAWIVIQSEVLALLNHNNVRYTIEPFSFETSGWSFTGLLILGLAEVFRSGIQLKQESELTI